MSKIYLITAIALIFLGNFVLGSFANSYRDKHRAANVRAALAKAKSPQEAFLNFKKSGLRGRTPESISNEIVNEEYQTLMGRTQQKYKNSSSMMNPRNGGCEPRVICKPVSVDHVTTVSVAPFPVCIEIHQCGGCCHEAQFSCVPVEEVPVTFSPIILYHLDGSDHADIDKPLELMNHTKCECKCNKTEAECRREGKKLDSKLCECVEPQCYPPCVGSSKCSLIENLDIERCTCDEVLEGQSSNFCSNSKERPDTTCTRCERPVRRSG